MGSFLGRQSSVIKRQRQENEQKFGINEQIILAEVNGFLWGQVEEQLEK